MKLPIFLLAMLVASPAFATNEWTACGSTNNSGTNPSAGTGVCLEWRATSATATSATFRVSADAALACIDSDVAQSEGAGTFEVMIQRCLDPTVAVTDNTCVDVLAAALTGLGGSSTTQNACLRIPRGQYRVVITAPTAAEVGILQVQGEN